MHIDEIRREQKASRARSKKCDVRARANPPVAANGIAFRVGLQSGICCTQHAHTLTSLALHGAGPLAHELGNDRRNGVAAKELIRVASVCYTGRRARHKTIDLGWQGHTYHKLTLFIENKIRH